MISFTIKTYDGLSKDELYDIMSHRQEVFAAGMGLIYNDLDYFDQKCCHLMAAEDGRLIGYTRILPAGCGAHGIVCASFGRVSVVREKRGCGLGRELVNRAVSFIKSELGSDEIEITAMAYLERFYTELGFKRISGIYDIDNVPHITMRYSGQEALIK